MPDRHQPPPLRTVVMTVDAELRERLVRLLRGPGVDVLDELPAHGSDDPPVVITGSDPADVAAACSRAGEAPVVAVGVPANRTWVRATVSAGAIGIVDRDRLDEILVERVSDAAHGVSVLPAWLLGELAAALRTEVTLNELASALHEDVSLTDRERAALVAVGAGQSVPDVAAELECSERQLRRMLARVRTRFAARKLHDANHGELP